MSMCVHRLSPEYPVVGLDHPCSDRGCRRIVTWRLTLGSLDLTRPGTGSTFWDEIAWLLRLIVMEFQQASSESRACLAHTGVSTLSG